MYSVNVHGIMTIDNKKVGIKEIALKAGVSIGTVDRVLHNRGEVKKETYERIMQIVNEFGYTPNLLAKALSSRKTAVFAIVIPGPSDNNPYWQKPVDGINIAEKELSAYNTRLDHYFYNATDCQSFTEATGKVLNAQPDGVILCPAFKEQSLKFTKDLDKLQIPYVFIDINLDGANSIGYYGQDAYQSGMIGARLMQQTLGDSKSVMIVKQSAKKIFSEHIESRIKGFVNGFGSANVKFTTIEIDLRDPNEPDASMRQALTQAQNNIFVPNSRSFVLAKYIEEKHIEHCNIIGYDLLNDNIEHLKRGNISFLLNQRPDEQSYKAVMRLFNYVAGNKEILQRNNYSPIDIIIKENVDYYRK